MSNIRFNPDSLNINTYTLWIKPHLCYIFIKRHIIIIALFSLSNKNIYIQKGQLDYLWNTWNDIKYYGN
jgi:hypothetical protein